MAKRKGSRIAMKFGMLVIGLGEIAVSIDELAQRKALLPPFQKGATANDNVTCMLKWSHLAPWTLVRASWAKFRIPPTKN